MRVLSVNEMLSFIGSSIPAKLLTTYDVDPELQQWTDITFTYTGRSYVIQPYDQNTGYNISNLDFLTVRNVMEYEADITDITMPGTNHRTAQLLIEPIYARNCKFFDACFMPWCDLGESKNTYWRPSLRLSYYYGEIDGEPDELPVNPTDNPDHLHVPLLTDDDFDDTTTRVVAFRLGGTFDDLGVNCVRCHYEDSDAATVKVQDVFVGIFWSENNKLRVYIPVIETDDDALLSHLPDPDDRPENFGTDSTWAGGNGSFSAPSDDRGDGSSTAITSEISTRASAFDTAINSGGFNVYQILAADMPEIVSILFGNSYLSRFANTMYNPLSAIISYHLLPSNLCTASATTKALKAGGYNISAQMADPTTEYPIMQSLTTYFVGSVDLGHYFDAYPDFAPYTTLRLHLPYIGTINLDPAVCMYGSVSVYYVTDVVSGNVAAWVWCKDKNGHATYVYTATGNAAYSIPMFSQNQDGGAIGKIVGGIAQAAIGAASGNALGVLGGVGGVAAGAVTAASHQTVISGSFGGNAGLLCDTVCWLEVSRPEWCNPSTYADLQAMPAEVGGTLSSLQCHGYTVVKRIETDGLTATEPEIMEIERLLSLGVYISE